MWKQLEKFSKYELNEQGIVRNIKTGNNLKARLCRPGRNAVGYYVFDMYNDVGRKKSLKRSRILAILFIDNPEELPEVDHIDEDTLNDELSNLAWVTRKENCLRTSMSRKHSRYTPVEKEEHVLRLKEKGLTYSQIKGITGVPIATISRIVNGVNLGSTTRSQDRTL
jgi:hypothetical protein